MKKLYVVYVDYTTEENPRPFYVGKGSESRARSLKRNNKHSSIQQKFGIDRRIVSSTEHESDAFENEVKLISELHTFVNDPLSDEIACNMTLGGDGASGLHQIEILCMDQTGIVVSQYDSVQQAATEHNVKPEIIGRIASGNGRKMKYVNGFTFMRKDGLTPVVRKANSSPINEIQVKYTDVDGKITVFKSVNVTAQHFGVHRMSISAVIHGRTDAATQSWLVGGTLSSESHTRTPLSAEHKQTLSFANKGKKRTTEQRSKISAAKCKIVQKLDESGKILEEFKSAKDAQKALNVSKSTMLYIIHMNRVYKGFNFRYK